MRDIGAAIKGVVRVGEIQAVAASLSWWCCCSRLSGIMSASAGLLIWGGALSAMRVWISGRTSSRNCTSTTPGSHDGG
jgi:hypothetical protein